MKGIIYYYSSTGNTKLAVNYLKNHIHNAEIVLCDIANDNIIECDSYDFVGFASFAEYLGPPTLMKRFIETLSLQNGKPAFVLNTYGRFTGPTQIEFAKQVDARGFKVVAGHSLIMPMNYPPMKRKGKHSTSEPSPKEMSNYDRFIAQIERSITQIEEGEDLKPLLRTFSLKKLVPSMARDKVKKDFGIQQIDQEKCVNCGNCARVCGYNAIEMNPNPVVNHQKCNGCWACYNTCPKKAINAKSFKGEYQYKGPSKELVDRMSK
ncbi:MAG: EFR1 family ferrodoxin [Anaeromicrobium sp.]|jgi:ferredoxin/flavodoxin|uniref:EFR1 family ferrodoxin n=1 Tax=Anaeromicrobium sp. TaxID=1929132 RepID=UPI0025DB36BF|nr:EFR1 family ferrodoxin [Anaeromicrobium sp.]MCT4594989.1 EFR1 family ferrodoxin [Anaeromicrobium sp.]